MAKQVKEVKAKLESYTPNLQVSEDMLAEQGFLYRVFRGDHSFIKVCPLPDQDITVTILILLENTEDDVIGKLDYAYMNGLEVGNPILDNTPQEVVSFLYEELEELANKGILTYTEPTTKKKRKKKE